MNQSSQQAARAFAFSGATLLIGVMVFFFTQGIIPLIELPDIAGSVILLGFILVFLNLSFGLARRFCSRTFELEYFPYILGLVLIVPTLVLAGVTERFTGLSAYMIFMFSITLASLTGVFFGIRSGRHKRDKLIKEAMETTETEENAV